MDKKQDKIKKIQDERDEFKNKYLRALADYHNFEKRINEEKSEILKNATKNVMLRILPFLDNLEKAEVFVKDDGLLIIKKQFLEVLEQEGLKEIEVLNKEFDPHVAEAIDVVKDEKDNVVMDVVRKGYEFKGNVIRPAQVRVSKIL